MKKSFTKKSDIKFIYGESKMDVKSKEKIGEFFEYIDYPLINVILENQILIKFNNIAEITLAFQKEKTMSELIKTFLDNYICKRPDLINNINNIQFKYGESLIYLYSNEKIGKLMKNKENLLIEVILPNTDFIVFFQTNRNVNSGVFTNTEKTIQEMIQTYFYKMKNDERFKNQNNIEFKFGEKKIDANSKEKVGQFLIFIKNPLIHVILPTEEIVIKFKNAEGLEENLKFQDDRKMGELIKTFLDKFGKSDICKNKNNIIFKYGERIIDSNCKDKVGQFLGDIKNPVIDIKEEIVIKFKNSEQLEENLKFEDDRKMNELINTFLNKFGISDICKNKKNIIFEFGEKFINFNCQDKVGQFLGYIKNPVIDVKEGIAIKFCNIAGSSTFFSYDREKTVSELIKDFLNKFGRPDLFINKKEVVFLYSATSIKFDSKIKVGAFFSQMANPIILITDTKQEINLNQN